MLLDQVFAVDRDGLPCAMKGTIVAPRQNLKTGFGKMCARVAVRDRRAW